MDAPPDEIDPGGASPHVWVTSTYFGEGFPYSVVNNLAEVLFKELGASLEVVGLTALLHLPWNLKFLWGPFLDRFETKRWWLIGTEIVLSVLTLGLAFVVSLPNLLGLVAAVFLAMAFLSATHDVAIDGFYLEGLDEDGQSKFVGYRALAYKVASLVVTGPLVILAGSLGWNAALLGAAAIMVGLTALHWFVLPRVERRRQPVRELLSGALRLPVLLSAAGLAGLVAAQRRFGIFDGVAGAVRSGVGAIPYVGKISAVGWISVTLLLVLLGTLAALGPIRRVLDRSDAYYARAFVDFLDQPKVGLILAFVILFRSGESLLMKMKWPFLSDAMGMSLPAYGWANGTFGVAASFAGTFLAGWLIGQQGLRRWIWPFVLAQNLLNLLFAAVALVGVPLSAGWLTAILCIEQFGAGLGTAVFMVYLMRCVRPDHKAAHMAILTALMSVGFTLAGVMSGALASALGFGPYFLLTFLATIPGMLLIPFIPHLEAGRDA